MAQDIFDIPNAGPKARQLLDSDVFKQCVEQMRQDLIDAAMRCDPRDDLGRFRYMTALKTISGVVTHLRALADLATGETRPDPAKIYSERSRGKLAVLLNR
jgi:hypothetical protein